MAPPSDPASPAQSQADDLHAAANAARDLASMVCVTRALISDGASKDTIRRLHDQVNDSLSAASEAIRAVAMELRRPRDKAVRLGDIFATTAHEATIKMVYALNQELCGERFGIRIEPIGREAVRTWPRVDEVIAEIELEQTWARACRADRACPDAPIMQVPAGFRMRDGVVEPLTCKPAADKGEQPAEQATSGMTWQEAADRMERLRTQGDPFTSQHILAEQFHCSSATINKAIRNTPSLQAWAKPTGTSAPRAQSLNEMVTHRTAQNIEPDPADDAAIREYLEREDLPPDERAFFNSLKPKDQLFFLNDPDKHQKILGRKP